MPELPEVETIVRDVRPALVGRTIRRVTLSHDDVLRGVTRRRLIRRLTGAKIQRVFRRAKHAVLELGEDRLVIQPGMTGSLTVHRRALSPEQAKYAVLTLELDRGGILVYRDVRRLGTLLLLDEKGWARYTAAIGPEPLDDEFSAERLGAALQRSRQAIKKVIMDQRHLAGVGNIYANEALFAAGIDPSKPASKLKPEDHRRLHAEIRRILSSAIRSNGTTFRDYRMVNGESGRNASFLVAYGQADRPCPRCGTPLRKIRLGGRGTTFCPRCQRP